MPVHTPPRPRAPGAPRGPGGPPRVQNNGWLAMLARGPVAILHTGVGLLVAAVQFGVSVITVVGQRILPQPVYQLFRCK